MTDDWNALPFAIDVSHHNGMIDWPKVAAQRPACVFIKASERMGVDPQFEANRRAAAAAGLLWVPYVFLRPDDNDAVIQNLLGVLGSGAPPVALDWEAPGVPTSVVEAWIDGMEADQGRTPIAYYGAYPPAAASPKIGRCPRWYPQYPGSATADPRLPRWDGAPNPDWRTRWLIWQWSDKGSVLGVPGSVDLNRLACPADVFEGWYRTGEFAALPPEQRPAPPSPPPKRVPVRIGDRSADAAELQRRLIAKGFDVGRAGADGQYGPNTDKAFWAWAWGELEK